MKRSMLALALASLSFGTWAAEKPLPVTVTNPVLAVEVSNADPIPVEAGRQVLADLSNSAGSSSLAAAATSGYDLEFGAAQVFTALQLQVDASASSKAVNECRLTVALQNASGTATRHLLTLSVLSGVRDSVYLPLPNVLVSEGDKLKLGLSNATDNRCLFVWNIYGTLL